MGRAPPPPQASAEPEFDRPPAAYNGGAYGGGGDYGGAYGGALSTSHACVKPEK